MKSIYQLIKGIYFTATYKKRYGAVRGKYENYDSAKKQIKKTWQDVDIKEYKNNFLKIFKKTPNFIHIKDEKKSYNSNGLFSWDYPTIFWLNNIFTKSDKSNNIILDFGGNIGNHFYLYKKYLNLSPHNWIVVELENFIEAGRSLNNDNLNLNFNNFENVITEKALIFHASGALQYLNESLVDVILKFETLPDYIIINRTPFSAEKSFYTIQNGGSSEYVMKIISFNEIDKLLEYYEILDDWFDNIDKCYVPFKSTKVFYKGYLLNKIK